MKIVLTGFGVFEGVTLNPTQRLVQRLLQSGHDLSDLKILDATKSGVLDVSMLEVDKWHCQNSTDDASETKMYIHMGVAPYASITLEICAYNDCTFRVPDTQGCQPRGKKIVESGTSIERTKIPVDDLSQQLLALGHCLNISEDPGRYLCNYIYYKSLISSNGNALFVHVPPFDVLAEEEQYRFLIDLLKLLGTYAQV